MAPGTAQGIAIHKEYKGATACLVELDCRPETVNRKVRDGVTGPRVTRATIAVDAGLVINPTGLKAQMMGGFADGMALTLTSSVHLRDGHFLEASWDNYFYTRQWNIPPQFDVVIVDSGTDQPGGAGEAGVAASAAAVACAFARATGKMPTKFPINHDDPISFDVKTFVPPVPESPTDGLEPHLLRSFPMPKHTFVLNRKPITVDVEDDVRLLWVIRDIVGLTGPKYGCGINVCKACTSHLNGKAFNPCSVRVADIKETDEVTTIEGLADTVDADLHPMQEAWLEYDVAQCGYCQPGQIMAAVAKVRQARAEGHEVTDADLDEIRNVCRCGTYSRIREAIKAGAAQM